MDYEPVETFGSGYILFTHMKTALKELGGRVVVRVVVDKSQGDEAGSLVYALFYEDKHGRFFDVLQQRNAELKTFSRADTLVGALARIGLMNETSIPALDQSNVIQKGELRGS